jgi:hypothetical protein
MAANPMLATNSYGGMAMWHHGLLSPLTSQLLACTVTKIFLIEMFLVIISKYLVGIII